MNREDSDDQNASREKASRDPRSVFGNHPVVITIDGPAGAGKSSVARALARHFGFAFLDTGAMYRTVALACLRQQVDWDHAESIVAVADRISIQFDRDRVILDGDDVTDLIRTQEVNRHIRHVADNPSIRKMLGSLQRSIARGRQIVTEGRDQGTEIFQDATCKIFLTARPETRATRRHAELVAKPGNADLTVEEVLATQQQRDEEDASRPVGALRPAPDARVVFTDEMSQHEVVQHLADLVLDRWASLQSAFENAP